MPEPAPEDDVELLLAQLNDPPPASVPAPAPAPPLAPEAPPVPELPVVLKEPKKGKKDKQVAPSPPAAVVAVAATVVSTDGGEKPAIDPARLMADFDKQADDILKKVAEDRGRARSIMVMCEEAIRPEGGPANHEAPRIFLEAMVKALEVGANANQTAVKVLDSRSKLVIALKGQIGVNINNNNSAAAGAGVDPELTRLLEKPTMEDF
jgi:hypothetical protein